MKKLLACVLAALLLCTAASAEYTDNAPDLPGAEKLTVGEKTEIDLDGDGESELLRLEMRGDPENPQHYTDEEFRKIAGVRYEMTQRGCCTPGSTSALPS